VGRWLVFVLLALAAALPATATAAPTVREYDLGRLDLAQDNPVFPTVPIELQGVIGVPEGAHAAPVVVILHGRHSTCAVDAEVEPWPCPAGTERRNDLGFRYLVESLAARGYLALAVNLNAAYTLGAGETPDEGRGRTDAIVAAQLARLADAARGAANPFGAPLKGRADLTRLILVGHSKGGEAAMYLARQHRKAKDPAPGAATDGKLPVDAAVLVAPTFEAKPTQPQVDIPTAVLLPACDGDVSDLAGAAYYDAARLSASRKSLAASVFVRGANHNFFNQAVTADDARDLTTPGCPPGDALRLKPKAQRSFLSDYVGTFIDAIVRGIVSGGLDPYVQPPAELFGAKVVTSLTQPAAQRRLVVEPRSGLNLRRDALGGRVATAGGAQLSYCQPGRRCRPALQQPSYPGQLRLVWRKSGGLARFAIPPASGDVSAYDLVSLRVAVDPTAPENPAGKAQAFSIALVDAAGKRARVIVPATQSALAYPIGNFAIPDAVTGFAPLGSVRVPLSLFSGVDVRRIRAIEVRGDRTASGALLLANLELADLTVATPTARAR
jgi:dienelactone hydrolase